MQKETQIEIQLLTKRRTDKYKERDTQNDKRRKNIETRGGTQTASFLG
jgi:hypothetical protein